MRWLGRLAFILATWGCLLTASAASTKILKVLPQFLDAQGRHALSPSLYERDAYQAQLRKAPDQVRGLQYNVQWQAPRAERPSLTLRLELRGSKTQAAAPLRLEQPLKRTGWPECWTRLLIDRDAYNSLGSVIAWRVSLWKGDQLVAEKQSFLW